MLLLVLLELFKNKKIRDFVWENPCIRWDRASGGARRVLASYHPTLTLGMSLRHSGGRSPSRTILLLPSFAVLCLEASSTHQDPSSY
jgi:hypothetical protein